MLNEEMITEMNTQEPVGNTSGATALLVHLMPGPK